MKKYYEIKEIYYFDYDYNKLEISVMNRQRGCNYLVIVSKHVNGWYIAIPNMKVCVEAGYPTSVFYNFEKLSAVLNQSEASIISSAICDCWETHYG